MIYAIKVNTLKVLFFALMLMFSLCIHAEESHKNSVAKFPPIVSIVKGDSGYVAVGSPGCLYHSDNIKKWIKIGLENNNHKHINKAYWGNRKYILVGRDGFIATSVNGADWQSTRCAGLHECQGENLVDITYFKQKYIAIGSKGIMYSSDLVKWSYATGGSESKIDYYFKYIVDAGDRLIAYGPSIYVSLDGIQWDRLNNKFRSNDIVWHDDKYLSVYGNKLYISNDLSAWTVQYQWGEMVSLNSLTVSDGWYVIVGNNGLVYLSNDLLNWQSITVDNAAAFNDVIIVDDKYILAADYTVKTIRKKTHGNSFTTEIRSDNHIGAVIELEGSAYKWDAYDFYSGQKECHILSSEQIF